MAKLTVDELKTELKSSGFSDEQLTGMTKPQLEALANGYMRQSDYDREMNAVKTELQKEQDRLARANENLNAEMAEWASVKAKDGEVTVKMQRDLEAAQAAVATLRTRVSSIATQAGLDPSKALEGLDQPPPPKPAGPDLTGYVKTEDIDRLVNERLGGLANGILDIPTELNALNYEHQQLFGKPMTPAESRAIVAELKSRAGTKNNQKSLNPADIWAEQHKVPEAREAKAKAQYDADMKAAEQRGREAALSEQLVPGSTNTPGQHSVVFSGERKSKLDRTQPQTTVHAAAAAFRTGKYRKEGAGHSGA